MSCGHSLAGFGFIKMVDPDCVPIKNQRIGVNNVESGGFLNSGHLTKDVYYTDKQGVFKFDIEKSADRLIIFLPDAKGGKKGGTNWNWYTVTSNNDEVLFSGWGSGHIPKFKAVLLKSSEQDPIAYVYPYKNTTCENSYLLDKYNPLKIEYDRNAKAEAAEKARLDAIKVVIPKYTIRAYGIMKLYSVPGDAGLEITGSNDHIKKEQQKLYTQFGIFVTASEPAVLKHSSDITYNIIYPEPGLTNPDTGITTKSYSIGYWEKHSGTPTEEKMPFQFVMSMIFREPWQIKSGEWIFQIKHKDTILLEQSFIVE